MNDLVERLRSGSWCGVDHCTDIQNEAASRIEALSRMLYDCGNSLERAYCIGEGYHPDYGWPIGEQIDETMADAIIDRIKTAEARIVELEDHNIILKRAVGEEGRANRMTWMYEQAKAKLDAIDAALAMTQADPMQKIVTVAQILHPNDEE